MSENEESPWFASQKGFHSTNLGFDEPAVNIKIFVNHLTIRKNLA